MIIKELYKNIKLISILLLIIFVLVFIKKGGMRKTIENFENKGNVIDTLVNTYDIAERKINDVFSKIDANSATVNKRISANKGITTTGIVSNGEIKVRNNNSDTIVLGKKGTIYTRDIQLTGGLKVKNSICIGNTCITEKQLKFLTEGFTLMTKKNGHRVGGFIHTHSNGNVAWAQPQHKTTYQMK